MSAVFSRRRAGLELPADVTPGPVGVVAGSKSRGNGFASSACCSKNNLSIAQTGALGGGDSLDNVESSRVLAWIGPLMACTEFSALLSSRPRNLFKSVCIN